MRELYTSTMLVGYSNWIGLSQVCRLCCRTYRQGIWHEQLHYKVSSLTSQQADAKTLLQLSRGHWASENQVHYVRDVTMAADGTQTRKGAAPQAMAAMRNLVLSVLHGQGWHKIASSLRHLGWQPHLAAIALGLCPP